MRVSRPESPTTFSGLAPLATRHARALIHSRWLALAEEFAPFAPYRPLGITRVSLGLASTMADVSAFVSFVKKFFVQTSVHRPLLPSESTSSQEHTSATHVRKAQLTEVMLCKVFLSLLSRSPC
jgi:hypothetical protein